MPISQIGHLRDFAVINKRIFLSWWLERNIMVQINMKILFHEPDTLTDTIIATDRLLECALVWFGGIPDGQV